MEPTTTWGNGLPRRCIGVFFTLPELDLVILGHLKVEDVRATLGHYVDIAAHDHLDVLNDKLLPRDLKIIYARPDRTKL